MIAAHGTGLHATELATRKNSHAVDILAKNTVLTVPFRVKLDVCGFQILGWVWNFFHPRKCPQCLHQTMPLRDFKKLVLLPPAGDQTECKFSEKYFRVWWQRQIRRFYIYDTRCPPGFKSHERKPPQKICSLPIRHPLPHVSLGIPPHSHSHRPALHLYACSSPYSSLNSDCLFSSYFIPRHTIYSSDSIMLGSQCECGMLQFFFSFSSSRIAAQ